MPMKNTDFTLVQLGGEKDPMRQKDTSTGDKRGEGERDAGMEGWRGGGVEYTVCPLSRCHPAGRSLTFRPCDTARPRVDSPPAILTLIWRAAVAMSMKH